MRIVFAGTPEFARAALEQLHAAGFQIALVLTQPDRPAGRGLKLQASPVKQFALDHGFALAQPRSLRRDGKYPLDAAAAGEALHAANAQAMVVAAYGLILPQWVLDTMQGPGQPGVCATEGVDSEDEPQRGQFVPNSQSHSAAMGQEGGEKWTAAHRSQPTPLLPRRLLGCFNIHASLLPRWRGAAPIHRAIEAGDAQTGISIMQMDEGLDTGAMLLVESVAIARDGPNPDTTGSLHDKLAPLGARMVVQALRVAELGGLVPTPQPVEGVTYAHKIEKHEAQVNWTQAADLIVRRIRAFNPFPGAFTHLDGEIVKVWAADVADVAEASDAAVSPPGTVVAVASDSIRVAAGQGSVEVRQLQRAGGKRMGIADFMRGSPVRLGALFGLASAAHADAG